MAHKVYKILLKTLADVSGVAKLSAYLKSHSIGLLALKGTYKAVGATGKAAFSLISAELRYLRNAAAGGAGALALAVREGAKLNLSLAQTVNMAGGSKIANFVKFRTEILKLSSDVGIATDQINAGLYQALSAQMAPEQAFAAIRKASQGVIADGAELKDVMSGIIAGVKSFGGDVDQTAEQLYRIVQLGQTTFGEVGAYLSQVAPVAAANKISLGEVGGAIAQLTSKTIPLSQSVVMLRNMMSRLNNVLGDGWRQSYTFQDAMEAVAKSAKYSQVELGKLFGIEGLAGVNALVGDNFADATKQAAEFKGELRGLAEGAGFVDQFRGFANIWVSLRNYVKEIGSEIEQRWAPRINFIAAKIAEMRQGEGWKQLVDTISAKLEATVTWAIVQVKTAADLIQHLRSQDFGMARMAEVGKTVVVELVTMAVTLLMALMKANMSVFVALVKIVAAAFKQELLDVLRLIPGMTNQVEKMAYENYYAQSDNGKQGMAESLGFADPKAMMREVTTGKRTDLIAAMAAYNSGEDAAKAMSEAAGKLKDTLQSVDTQWTQSKANIKAAAGRASGGGLNWDEQSAENRKEVESFMTPSPTEPGSLLSRRQATPKSRAQLEAELEDLKMKAMEAEIDQDIATMPTQEEQKFAKWQQSYGGRNLAPNSFSAKEGRQLDEAAKSSRAEANQAAQEAVAALNAITGMMKTMAGAINNMQGEMQKTKSQVQKASTV